MGKIHTHYDNLKVSRMAPQEVIRAAYKALSQKYHPDKNPGDEKAARIMAIVNSAYGTLADPQRRKEHDEWIAAEEWEIEWLESTRHEDAGHKHGRHDSGPAQAWADDVEAPRRKQWRRRHWKWWAALAVCLMAGWVAGVLTADEPRLQAVLAAAWDGKAAASAAAAVPSKPGEAQAGGAADAWTIGKPALPEGGTPRPPPIKVVTLSQIVLPGAVVDCENAAQLLLAPNGEPWPAQSGYVDGFPIGNRGDDMQLSLDNAANDSAVFIKVYDLDRKSNVRYVFVQAHDTLLVDKLTTGKYEIRYQNLDAGQGKRACEQSGKTSG